MSDEEQRPPLSGAQFARKVGADPQKWASEFLVAYAEAAPAVVHSDAERLAFVTQWFRDAMQAAIRAADDTHDSGLVKYGAGMMRF